MLKILIRIFSSKIESFFRKKKEEVFISNSLEENIHAVLTYIAESNHQHLIPSQVLEIIRQYRHTYPVLDSKNIDAYLSEISGHYKVRLNTVSKNLKEIQTYISEDSPFIFFRINDLNLHLESFSIVSYHAGAYHIQELGDHSGSAWISEKDLIIRLGLEHSTDQIHWIVSEPIFPFSSNSTQSKKSTNISKAIEQIFQLLRLERRDIGIIVIYGIGIGILSLVIPIATSSLVNIVSFGVLIQPVVVLTFLVVCFLGFAGAMQIIQTYVIEILQRRVFVRIATEFAAKFPKIKQEALDSFHKPELANRFFDTVTIQKAINTLLVDGLAVVLTTIIGFTLIGIYHPIFLLFAMIILFIGGYFIVYKMGRAAGESHIKVSGEKYRIAAWIEEISRHTAIFHSKFGANFGLEKADSIARDYLYARENYFKKLIRQIAGLIVLQTLASAVVLGIGGYLVIHRQLTIGQLVAAELVIAKVLSDIAKFGKHLDSFYSLISAVDKINTVFQLPIIKSGITPYTTTDKPIEVEISHLSYSLANKHTVFSDLSLKLTSKSITGIRVSTPYDANVFLDLIAAIRVPSHGSVSFDKQNIHETDYHQNHDDSFLIRGNEIFEGSILDNIRMGRDHISLIEIREALESLDFWTTVEKLPQGLHTHLLTFGHPFDNIQTGMMQIARAILGKPRLLLIDGTLDSLPPNFQKSALKILLNKNRPWTLVIVSRSEQILGYTDQILHLMPDEYKLTPNKNKGVVS